VFLFHFIPIVEINSGIKNPLLSRKKWIWQPCCHIVTTAVSYCYLLPPSLFITHCGSYVPPPAIAVTNCRRHMCNTAAVHHDTAAVCHIIPPPLQFCTAATVHSITHRRGHLCPRPPLNYTTAVILLPPQTVITTCHWKQPRMASHLTVQAVGFYSRFIYTYAM